MEQLICRLSVLSPYVKELGFRRPESNLVARIFSFSKPGIRKIFGWRIGNPEICACRIRNPGLWNPEYRSGNPESKVHWQRIPNTAPGIGNPWRATQNLRLSWIPFKGWVQVAYWISTHMFDEMEWLPFHYHFKKLVYISVSSKRRKCTVALTTDRLSCYPPPVMLLRKVGYTHY